MTGKTHLGGGILTAVLICNNIISGLLVVFGSILPDIDHPNSFLGKNIPFVSKCFKHRGFTHSLLFAFIVWIINQWVAYGILVHIFLDMMTCNGVSLSYPKHGKVRFPFAKYITTDNWFEKVLFYLLWIGIVFLFLKKFIL